MVPKGILGLVLSIVRDVASQIHLKHNNNNNQYLHVN